MSKKIVKVIIILIIFIVSGCESKSIPTIYEGSYGDGNDNILEDVLSNTNSVSDTDSKDNRITPQKYPFNLIDSFLDANYRVSFDVNKWYISDNYNLFRKYFFGVWSCSDFLEIPNIIIDDSEKYYEMTDYIYNFYEFYEINDNVLAFITSGNAEGIIFWLNINSPNIMYACHFAWPGCFLFSETTELGVLNKTDQIINEPSDGFLSIFKLHEISTKYNIDFEMLTVIDYGFVEDKYLIHNTTYDFYPMYLVSEENGRIIIKTSVGNVAYNVIPKSLICTFKMVENEWVRNIESI